MTRVEIIITECVCVRACFVPFFFYNKDLGSFIVLSRGS